MRRPVRQPPQTRVTQQVGAETRQKREQARLQASELCVRARGDVCACHWAARRAGLVPLQLDWLQRQRRALQAQTQAAHGWGGAGRRIRPAGALGFGCAAASGHPARQRRHTVQHSLKGRLKAPLPGLESRGVHPYGRGVELALRAAAGVSSPGWPTMRAAARRRPPPARSCRHSAARTCCTASWIRSCRSSEKGVTSVAPSPPSTDRGVSDRHRKSRTRGDRHPPCCTTSRPVATDGPSPCIAAWRAGEAAVVRGCVYRLPRLIRSAMGSADPCV